MIATSRRLGPVFWLLLAVMTGLALLPWWRNHDYLRDLYDYGVVLEANGRMTAGERPYVDFKTPMQAGFLGLNWAIERLGGGTYGGLTRGGAGLIVVSTIALALLLARRWPAWAAVVVAGSVTLAGASQHTILVHNALGILCLAVATWSAASAPVARRASWRWHLLAAAALFVGGINKLNFQLVAVAVCAAWALRAGLLRQCSWRRVLATLVGMVLVGVVLPVAMEMAWTGASLQQWFGSVVLLPGRGRGGQLTDVFSLRFLIAPLHDWYGNQIPRPVGLVGLVLSLAAWLGCRVRPDAGGVDRWLLPAAALVSAAAGAALLATNVEIASVGLGAWLVLACSLWLGFGEVPPRRAWLAGVVLPALMLGAAAWWNAWQGYRSQFGFSPAARADYVPAASIAPAFASLHPLRLPPDVALSLEVLERALPPPGADGRRPVFYGQGLEVLDRYYPAVRQAGQPLWVHWGTTYGPSEVDALVAALEKGVPYRAVFFTVNFEKGAHVMRDVLVRRYVPEIVGPTIRRWTWREPESLDRADSLGSLLRLGGNVDVRAWHLDRRPFDFRTLPDGRAVMGTVWTEGSAKLMHAAGRMRGVAVLARLPGTDDGPLTAHFRIIVHGADPEEARWASGLELPAGQAAVSVPFEFDAAGRTMMFLATQPQADRGYIGYREVEILHAVEASGGAPQLRAATPADTAVTPELADSLLGGVAWRPQQWTVRGGRPGAGGLELAADGEVWLHSEGMQGELSGQLATAGPPVLARVVWYKGGRLQELSNGWILPSQPLEFRAATPEPGGWVGILVEGKADAPAIRVRITGCSLAP